MSALRNFRVNFTRALEADGRSLTQFSKDMGMSIAHVSRIRSGSEFTPNKKAVNPRIAFLDEVASALGLQLYEMLMPCSTFLKILKGRYPGYHPTKHEEHRGRPANTEREDPSHKVKPKARRKKVAKAQ
jgi:transcriptional regulator with XRE-family HTH domain